MLGLVGCKATIMVMQPELAVVAQTVIQYYLISLDKWTAALQSAEPCYFNVLTSKCGVPHSDLVVVGRKSGFAVN